MAVNLRRRSFQFDSVRLMANQAQQCRRNVRRSRIHSPIENCKDLVRFCAFFLKIGGNDLFVPKFRFCFQEKSIKSSTGGDKAQKQPKWPCFKLHASKRCRNKTSCNKGDKRISEFKAAKLTFKNLHTKLSLILQFQCAKRQFCCKSDDQTIRWPPEGRVRK